MVILDTDHLSLLEHSGSLDRHRLLRKLSAVAGQGIATTIVSFEEQIRGRLAYLASTRTNASTDRGISSLEAATRQLLFHHRHRFRRPRSNRVSTPKVAAASRRHYGPQNLRYRSRSRTLSYYQETWLISGASPI